MRTFAATKAGYTKMWSEAELLPAKEHMAVAAAQKIIAHKAILLQVQEKTGVPWWFTGGLLYRESDLNFNTYIGNGQSLSRVTTEVPAGRGPFFGDDAFVRGCIDAYSLEPMIRNALTPWTIPYGLYASEEFNGEGYENKGINAPYVWAGTSWEQDGIFVADHVFDRNKRDPRVGVAAVYAAIAAIDSSILQPSDTPTKPQETKMPTAPTPVANTGFHIDLVGIEKMLGSLGSITGPASIFFPQLKAVQPIVQVIEGGLKMAEELQTVGHDPKAIASVISAHLREIADQVDAFATQL